MRRHFTPRLAFPSYYEEDALLLPQRDLISAAHNAENYACFIDGVA